MDKDNILQGELPEIRALIAELERKLSEFERHNTALIRQNEQLAEQVRTLTKLVYGPTSEKVKYIPLPEGFTQDNLFNEAEATAVTNPVDEPEGIEVPAHTRKPKRTKEELSKELEVKVEIHDLPEGERTCGICEGGLTRIGEDLVRRELNIIPAQAYITEIRAVVYKCPCCEKETDEANIVEAPTPTPVIKRGLPGPSAVAHVIYQKYVNAQPLYRQEKDWGNFGVSLGRGTMANWIIYVAVHWLSFLWKDWKERLLTALLIYADESVVQVLKEPGKDAQSQSRMWVYACGASASYEGMPDEPKIVLYEYQPDRAGKNAHNFLTIDQPFYLHTDGYAGYNGIPNAIHCGCWAHMRRKWNEAMPKSPPQDNPAYIGFTYCQRLFILERGFLEMSPEQRHIARQEKSKPVVEEYYNWLETILDPTYGGKLGIAVTYAKNQKANLMRFLDSGIPELSTNHIENAIRPFAVGRKNWLFADTQAGANASAVVYSIIETAKANGVNPYDYLLFLFTTLPDVLTRNPDSDLSAFAPWVPEVKDKISSFAKQR